MTSHQLILQLSAAVSEMIQKTELDYLVLSDRELASSPTPGSWSILQCFEHMNRYNRFYNAEIKKKMAAGKSSLDHKVRTTWIGDKSIAAMHPDNRKKQKTLRHLNPHPNLDRRAIEEFIQHQHELLSLLSGAKNMDLNTIRVSVEFFRLLKMNLAEAFQFVVLHQQRHFLQLARTSEQIRKPAEVFLKV